MLKKSNEKLKIIIKKNSSLLPSLFPAHNSLQSTIVKLFWLFFLIFNSVFINYKRELLFSFKYYFYQNNTCIMLSNTILKNGSPMSQSSYFSVLMLLATLLNLLILLVLISLLLNITSYIIFLDFSVLDFCFLPFREDQDLVFLPLLHHPNTH